MKRILALACTVLTLSTTALHAQGEISPAEAAAQELIAQEQLRAAVEESLILQARDGRSGSEKIENFARAALQLTETGADAVPYLVIELEQEFPSTFYFAAYTLGLIGTPEAEAALRASVERTNRSGGDLALIRKAWACFGLALMGRSDAVDLLNEGRHKAGHYSLHFSTSALEVTSLQTAPESIALLIAQLTNYANDEELNRARSYTIKALGRIGAPEALQPLLEIPDSGPRLHRDVMYALENIDTEEALAALVEGLGNDDISVRKAAAISLERRWPAAHIETLVGRLDEETQPVTRGAIYQTLARVAGLDALPVLRKHWGATDSTDRLYLQRALGEIPDESALDLIQSGIVDRDLRVSSPAVRNLFSLNTKRSKQATRGLLDSNVWPVVQLTVEEIARRRDRSMADGISERLFSRELAGPVTDPRLRDPIRLLTEALVTLRHHSALDSFREAAAVQTDAQLKQYLEGAAAQLEVIRENGKKIDKWVETTTVDDLQMRRIAYEVLGEIGSADAARALSRSFGRVEPEEGVIILRSLGQIDLPISRELIARVLTDPQFESFERLPLRDMAAWGARRIGGDEMVEAVKTAIEKRQGRDARILVYLALMDPKVGLPVLEAHHVKRMRFIGWSRGKEHRELAWVLRELRAGRAVDRLDLPPDLLAFH